MHCEEIHLEFIKDGHTEGLFCNEKLADAKSIETKCCERPNIINNCQIVCANCGTMYGYQTANEFVDFYDNMYRIRKKNLSIIENITF